MARLRPTGSPVNLPNPPSASLPCRSAGVAVRGSVHGHLSNHDSGVTSQGIESAPKLHLGYVNACNQIPSYGRAKALTRLIKAWKCFNNVPISSFYLEMRCAQHVAGEATYIHVWDVYEVLDSLYMQQLEPILSTPQSQMLNGRRPAEAIVAAAARAYVASV